MRVTSHQLAGNAIDHLVPAETLFLAGQLGVKHHLKQQITQLAAQLIEIALLDGIGDFVGLFQRMRHDGRVALLQIPWATVLRITQALHEVQQIVQLVTHPRPSWRLRRASITFGSWLIRVNRRLSRLRLGISMVSSIAA